jgi:DNA processing protein
MCHNSDPSRDLLIALSLLDFLTPLRCRRLREIFDPLQQVEKASPTEIAALLRITEEQARLVTKPLQLPAVARRVETLRDRVVTLLDDEYSPWLREIHDPPLTLYYRGNLKLLKTEALAMVGSRRASPYGVNVAQNIGRELVKAGLTIVSGLARGIDAAAHEAALRNGGNTIGVLGTGIDLVYPRFHRRLFDEIAASGLLITEFAPGTPPRPINFPIRNRVIAGLCLGTIVVEASRRSGSLITARLAAEEGREVFAVPGSILSTGTEGVHRLVQSGAKLLHDVHDVFEELRLPGRGPRPVEQQEVDPRLREVLELFSPDEPLHIDRAAAQTGQTIPEVSETLLRLELEGWLQALPGARYVRVIR